MWPQPALRESVKWYVMIPWDQQHRYFRQTVNEAPRLLKLLAFGALCEISANYNNVWIERGSDRLQCVTCLRQIGWSKV